MPDTPIDLSEGIQSVRLKVPTSEVPIPPEGFAQLHSPAPGALALRLPDGSVVPVGGGGGPPETPFFLLGSGGTVDTSADLHGVGVTIATGINKTIRLAAPLVDADFLPLGVQVDTVVVSSAEILALHTMPKVLVAAPAAGRVIVPLVVQLRLTVATPYAWGGAPDMRVRYTTRPAPLIVHQQAVGFLDSEAGVYGSDYLRLVASDYSGASWDGSLTSSVELSLSEAVTDGTGTLVATTAYLVL